MKLTKRELNNISKEYNLGKIENTKLLKGGLMNYNFEIKTEKGYFIIRILGQELEDWKRDKLKIEFRVLNYLRKMDFPYRIPIPLRNLQGENLLKLNEKNLWVYRKLEGETVENNNKINRIKFKEVVRCLATYNKYVQKMKIRSNKYFYNFGWLTPKYLNMKKVNSNEEIDRLMLDNIKFYESLLIKIKGIKFPGKMIPTHSDIMPRNLLFKGDKVVALLDFDNIEIAPRIKDVSVTIQRTCIKNKKLDKEGVKLLLREYEKINPLTRKEKEFLIPMLIRDYCIMFWWFYSGMTKRVDLKRKILKNIIKQTRFVATLWEEGISLED